MSQSKDSYIKKHEEQMLRTLSQLVAIKSVREESGQYPFGKGIDDALRYMLKVCGDKGFKTKYEEGYYGYCEYGQGKELATILVHLDTVPAGDGWLSPPESMQICNEKIIGRGVIDDKGPAVACLYALDWTRDILEKKGKTPKGRVRIVFGTDEETGGQDMKIYSKREELPTWGFTADADFPLVYAEKGIISFHILLDNRETQILSIKGGQVTNAVPGLCKVTLTNGVEKTYIGKEVHASEAEKGENAIAKALDDLESMKIISPLCEFWGKYKRAVSELSLLKDEISGCLTANIGTISMDKEKVDIGVDIRYPVTYKSDVFFEDFKRKLSNYGATPERVIVSEPLYISKDSRTAKVLMHSYIESTGDESPAVVTGGGTYARALPNIAAFGPVFPGRECTEHQPNEYMYVEDFFKITEIYCNAILEMLGER